MANQIAIFVARLTITGWVLIFGDRKNPKNSSIWLAALGVPSMKVT